MDREKKDWSVFFEIWLVCIFFFQDEKRVASDVQTFLSRFWKVAAPYWSSDDKIQARLRLATVFVLTLGTTGISVGFNFLGRDFYNALASECDFGSIRKFHYRRIFRIFQLKYFI